MSRSIITKYSESQWINRGWYLVTEFEQTNSKYFEKALALAQKAPGFIKLMDERNILIYRNIFQPEHLLEFEVLYELIRSWRNTKIYLKGEETDPTIMDEGVSCYIKTKLRRWSSQGCQSFNTEAFKLGYIGCWHSGVTLHWTPGASSYFSPRCWFFDGVLDSKGIYVIQKDEIYQRVVGSLSEYRHCPLLNLKSLSAFIEQLPDSINPEVDKEWKYTKPRRSQHTLRDRSYLEDLYAIPAVIPVSETAYRAYMERILSLLLKPQIFVDNQI
jgi:hypothetical protein